MTPSLPLDDAIPELDILTTRTFPVARERVFAAWADPAQLARWWGPEGFTNTFEEFDLRPGGRWRFTMHGPHDTHYPNESVFVEVTAPARIVFDHLSGPAFQVRATFTDVDGGTHLAFRMRFASAEACEAIRHFAGSANEQVFDRLATLLAERP